MPRQSEAWTVSSSLLYRTVTLLLPTVLYCPANCCSRAVRSQERMLAPRRPGHLVSAGDVASSALKAAAAEKPGSALCTEHQPPAVCARWKAPSRLHRSHRLHHMNDVSLCDVLRPTAAHTLIAGGLRRQLKACYKSTHGVNFCCLEAWKLHACINMFPSLRQKTRQLPIAFGMTASVASLWPHRCVQHQFSSAHV